MKTINIEINQAKIISYSVVLGDDYPDVSATIALFAGDKQISTFAISTAKYCGTKFDLPLEMINPIKEIADQLEAIVIRECSNVMGALPQPETIDF